jgi:hypothetical protein
MRKFDEFTELSRQLVRADSQLIVSLEQLREAIRRSYPRPIDQAALKDAKFKLNTFFLALGLRDQVADALDELKEESKRVADSC